MMSRSLLSSSLADSGGSAQSTPLSLIRDQQARMFADFAGVAGAMLLVRFMFLKSPPLEALFLSSFTRTS